MTKNGMGEKEIRLAKEITAYRRNIDQYRNSLQKNSVWLFLTVLGCWSVETYHIQFFAFILTAVFFGIFVVSELDDKKSFSRFENDIENLIEAEFIAGKKKEEYEEKLKELKEKRQSNIQPFKKAPMFFVCSAFYIFSFVDQLVMPYVG